MARKKADQAQSDLEQAHEVRLAYLSRNHYFRQDIQSLAAMNDALWERRAAMTAEQAVVALGPVVDRAKQLERVWDLPYSVVLQLSWPDWRPHPHGKYSAAEFRFGLPVVAWTIPFSVGGDDAPTREDSRYLNLRIDLDHPVDTLLPLVEKELSRYSQKFRRGTRRRLGQANFYLQVFDLADSDETFKAISLKLKRRLSTVKSAYLAASRNIFGPGAGPSKKALPLASFDPVGHSEECPTCQKAKTPKELCPKARLYANQDKKGQRELPGYDTVSE